jgi:tRNA(adenine34) deaminase
MVTAHGPATPCAGHLRTALDRSSTRSGRGPSADDGLRFDRFPSGTWRLAYWGITRAENPPLSDDAAMDLALGEARVAAAEGEVPVGAVVLVDGRVVATRHNERERGGDPTAHAELLALRDAAAALGGWRLAGATLVVTLEPCPMCAGALVAARVGRLVFGASDPKAGACGSLYNLCSDPRLNHEVDVTGGVGADECGAVLTSFFAQRRGEQATDRALGAGQGG